MSTKALSKKEYRGLFNELLAESTALLTVWVTKLGEYDAALDRGKPVDMLIENAMYDAEDDYKFSLVDLHDFLLRTAYVPPQQERDLLTPSATTVPAPPNNP